MTLTGTCSLIRNEYFFQWVLVGNFGTQSAMPEHCKLRLNARSLFVATRCAKQRHTYWALVDDIRPQSVILGLMVYRHTPGAAPHLCCTSTFAQASRKLKNTGGFSKQMTFYICDIERGRSTVLQH